MNIEYKKEEKGMFSNRYVRLLSRIFTVLLCLVVVYPLVFTILVSFKNNQEFYSNIWGLPRIWRWENYSYAWTEGKIGQYAINSVIVTLSAVTGSVLVTAFGGYALSKMRIPKANLILSAFMVFNFVPGVAYYIPLYSQMIGLRLSGTLFMLILPYLAWQIPFSVYIFKNFFDSIPSELTEAARMDGAAELQVFFQIMLPLVTPALATVTVFNFISIWGEYMWASISATSSAKIQTIPVGLLYFRGEYGIEWGPFAAAITIIVVPLIVVFIYFQKYFVQGITSSAVKG